MATTLFFEGRVIAKPGAVTRIDASGLESRGLGGKGRVAILGSSTSGTPASAISKASDFTILTRPSQVRDSIRAGDLREACAMAFAPSVDPQIPGGAVEVVPIRVDPATQASADFGTAAGTSLTVTSLGYGAYTEQISVAIANTPVSGRMVTVTFESNTEAFDNLGGTNMVQLRYLPPVGNGGWEAMTAQSLSSGIRAYGSRTDAGLATHVLVGITSGDTVRVVGTASDAGATVTIYGLDLSNVPRRETITIVNGNAFGTQTWSAVLGARMSAAAVGNVTIEDNTGAFPDLITFTAGQQERGLLSVSAMYVANTTLVMAADAAATDSIIIWGRGANGAAQGERIVLNGTTNVRSVSSWSQIEVIVLGDLDAARVLTTSAVAAATQHTVQNTLQKVADYFNGRSITGPYGFDFDILTSRLTLDPAVLDQTAGAGVNIFNAFGNFTATLNSIVETLVAQSQYVTAVRAVFAPMIRDVVITPINSTTYTVTLNGTAASYTSDASATTAEIQAGLVDAINNIPALYAVVTASSNGNNVRVTALTPIDYTIAVGANLSITAVQSTDGIGIAPDNTTQPVFLAGGADGAAAFSDWQTALDKLKLIRVNTIVVLTGDPAVHAALEDLCVFKGGPLGKSECDGIVGLSALDGSNQPTGDLPTDTSTLAQIVDINSRHIRAVAQRFTRFNTAGEREEFAPWFGAVLAAGMQAGAPVGTSLTNKFIDALDLTQHSSWNPIDDAEAMIQGGLLFAEEIDGVGRRWVRNVTTHLTTNNLAFVEASVNEAANFAAFEFRNEMERIVGQRGFAGTVSAAKGAATNKLDRLTRGGILTSWDALSFLLSADVLQVSVQIAPVVPINFVPITLHLVTDTIAA